MKSTISVVFVLAVLTVLWGQAATAQMNTQGHLFTVTTFHATMPDGGSAAERDSVLAMFTDLTKMNSKYVSQRMMRHSWGHNSQDWVIITEYATWDDIEAAGKIDEDNFKKKWPKGDFDKANRTFNKYFPTHSDEIYTELPKYTK